MLAIDRRRGVVGRAEQLSGGRELQRDRSSFAIVTPLTGGGVPLGKEQLSWAKYAVKPLAPASG